jgi:hypothetical protein
MPSFAPGKTNRGVAGGNKSRINFAPCKKRLSRSAAIHFLKKD